MSMVQDKTKKAPIRGLSRSLKSGKGKENPSKSSETVKRLEILHGSGMSSPLTYWLPTAMWVLGSSMSVEEKVRLLTSYVKWSEKGGIQRIISKLVRAIPEKPSQTYQKRKNGSTG